MKTIFRKAAYIILALAAAGCAKAVVEGTNVAEKRYLEAWIQNNYPNAKSTELGVYILEDTKGEGGKEVKEDGYMFAEYTTTDLEGNISTYTNKETAKQLGKYDTTTYYGPKVSTTFKNTIQAGLADVVLGMRVGDRKKVVIPGWLMTYSSYGSAEEYIEKATSGSHTIYDITIKDFTDTIGSWEKQQIQKYFEANKAEFGNMDTTKFVVMKAKESDAEETKFDGMYFKSTTKAEFAFTKDTTIYINYTGKLLNGLVFDTNKEKVAKDNGLYSASRTYEPVQIDWGTDYTTITMGSDGGSIITGFALALRQMGAFEKGIAVFTSPYGYSNSGSGSSIPGYSPLVFELEVVAKPEE